MLEVLGTSIRLKDHVANYAGSSVYLVYHVLYWNSVPEHENVPGLIMSVTIQRSKVLDHGRDRYW